MSAKKKREKRNGKKLKKSIKWLTEKINFFFFCCVLTKVLPFLSWLLYNSNYKLALYHIVLLFKQKWTDKKKKKERTEVREMKGNRKVGEKKNKR